MKPLINLLLATAALCTQAAGSPLPENSDKLASNTIVAEYVETKEKPCMFMTVLCPDRCGHGTRLAYFKVLANESYERPGKYGDDKIEPGSFATIDVQKDIPGQASEIAAAVSRLHPGDKVRFTITHYYTKTEQLHTPVRPVVQFETLR